MLLCLFFEIFFISNIYVDKYFIIIYMFIYIYIFIYPIYNNEGNSDKVNAFISINIGWYEFIYANISKSRKYHVSITNSLIDNVKPIVPICLIFIDIFNVLRLISC